MSFYSLPDDDDDKEFGLAPIYVRQAHMRLSRATAALRLYAKRGWNDSAVAHAHRVARQQFGDALDRWEFEENNPRLF